MSSNRALTRLSSFLQASSDLMTSSLPKRADDPAFVKGRLPATVAEATTSSTFGTLRGHSAADKGRTGEGYILAGEWISVTDVLREVSSVVGRPVPRLAVSPRFALGAARCLTWYCGKTGKETHVQHRHDRGAAKLTLRWQAPRLKRNWATPPGRFVSRSGDTVLWMRQEG